MSARDPTWTVQPGDTLWHIARLVLGDGRRWREIHRLNWREVPDPERVLPGQVLRLPRGSLGSDDGAWQGPVGSRDAPAADLYQRMHALLARHASAIGVEVALGAAVLLVESGGRGHSSDGRLKIRFDPHVFHKLTGETVAPPRPTQDAQYEAFLAAEMVDAEAAHRALAMGAAQIAGQHAELLHYPDARRMFAAFQVSEPRQVGGLFDFVAAQQALLAAARSCDFARFAHGLAPARNLYDAQLRAEYHSYRRVAAAAL
jgi:hypothetical protein